MSTSDTYEVYAIRYGTFDKRMRRSVAISVTTARR